MPQTELIPDAPAKTRGHTAIIWTTIVALTAAYYMIEHRNAQVSNLNAFTVTGDEMSEKVAEGDPVRRFAIPLIGIYGVGLLMLPGGSRLRLDSRLGWLLIGYIVWCGLSITWSEDPPLTLRHFTVLIFCSLGALGIAKQLTLYDLCFVTLVVSVILIFNGVRTELVMGTFRPFASDYRFAGTVHPNVQAPYCATMAVAAGFLASRAQRGRLLLWGLCLTAVVLLWLTKSRTVCGALLAAVLIYRSFGVPWTKRVLIGSTVVFSVCAVMVISMLLGYNPIEKVSNVVLIGREEEADSFSGRVPLWKAVLPFAEDNFLLGHGYLTFWNPHRIDTFSQNFQWTVPDGHCAYLDTILDLGIVGAVLCLVVLGTGISEVGHCCRLTHDWGYGFLFVLLVCRSLNGLLESAFTSPTNFCAFVMVCGLVHIGYCRDPDVLPAPVASLKEVYA